jgi:hypothetical protein
MGTPFPAGSKSARTTPRSGSVSVTARTISAEEPDEADEVAHIEPAVLLQPLDPQLGGVDAQCGRETCEILPPA